MYYMDKEKVKTILVFLASISDKLSVIIENQEKLINISTTNKKAVKTANKGFKGEI